jgi:hypothetical protein
MSLYRTFSPQPVFVEGSGESMTLDALKNEAARAFPGYERVIGVRSCPYDCPCERPKRGLQSQRQPIRSIREVLRSEGITRKIEGLREADFRLANRPLQPLGHLTAVRNLSINDITTYTNAIVPTIVPEIVPASSQNPPWNGAVHASWGLIRMQRFVSPTSMPANDWRAPLCAHVLASTSLVSRV